MSPVSGSLTLLGLAEALSAEQVCLGDGVAEALVHHLLDRFLDAVVDITQGREQFSRVLPPPEMTPLAPADLSAADPGSCSALAARCQHLATRLEHADVVEVSELVGPVSTSLRRLAVALQDLVQDLPHEAHPVIRQRLLRSVRGATALLAPAEP